MSFIVKNTTFPGLLDLLVPHSCRGCGLTGEPLCNRCKNYILKAHKNICPNCKKEKSSSTCKNCSDLPPLYVISDRNGLLGPLIHDYKYYSIRALGRPLAELLSTCLPQDLPKGSILVPLPTSTRHVRSRGFDHTYLIAKSLSKLRHLPLERVLIRNKNTTQVGSNREKRLSQASSAYQINPKAKIDPAKTYILLDDIWTTGASIKAAVKKLQQAGAKNIQIALLAYSIKD
ncbi:ComF family protein [Candidatus Saccharibacteria bacterium]|nr:ComF family protein [Candidatus Saccharibacteria bacterium]